MYKNSLVDSIDSATMNNGTIKPDQTIQQLIDMLQPHARKLLRQADHSLNAIEFSKRQCFLLTTGHVSLCRQSDGLVLNTESAPFVFGFSDLLQTSQNITVYPGPNATLSTLRLEEAWKIVAQEDKWKSLSILLMYISHRLFNHCTRMSQLTSYGTIRTLLLELYAEPEALRLATPALQYIQSRCFLSRSGIMYALSQLRAGNYITIKKGRLIEMSFLPTKF